jgi:tetratricopeptide (TPR) repeat protein
MAAVTSIVNETPSRLTLTNIDGEQMVLAPLQEKAVSADSGFDFDDLARKGIVATRMEAPSSVGENIAVALFGGGFWLAVLAIILANTRPQFGIRSTIWPYAVWGAMVLILILIVVVLIIRGTNSFSLVARWTKNAVALTVILAIGLGLPAATIYFFGGGRELLGNPNPTLALFGRLIQLALIATASLLPVLLFFLFDRYQLSTLRKRLYVSLFRLDRSVTTISEINAKYGSQIGEAYGFETQGRGRLAPGTRWPVLFCAFVMVLGWIVALAPVGKEFAPGNAREVLASLVPQRSAIVFGFLGVYFFSLRVIALRYARGDLKPKAYTNIMVRLFIVLVLSWVLEAAFSGDSSVILVLAFLFGITPDEFFTWLRQMFRDKVPESAFPQSTLPLNGLEGIDLYELARLESEGIVNIEGLAHHELIDLIIETQIPVPRLIDWVDQAILYLHLIGGTDDTARTKLREYGIRTATDLMLAWEKAKNRGKDEMEGFKKLLGGAQPPYRLEVIRDALRDDEWYSTVCWWRREELHAEIHARAEPSTVLALESMADKEIDAKRYRRALRLLTRSLEIQDTAATRRRIARLLSTVPVKELRNSKEAVENAQRASELAPDDYENTVELIEIYLGLNNTQQAAEMYARAEKILNSLPKETQQEARKRLDELKKLVKVLPPNPGVTADTAADPQMHS